MAINSCQDSDEIINENPQKLEVHDKTVHVTTHDGKPFSTGNNNSANGKFVSGAGGGVMMQGFYWDIPAGGTWWNTVTGKVTDWSNAGMSAVWLPPASKRKWAVFYGI